MNILCVSEENVSDRSVTVSWPENEAVTRITVLTANTLAVEYTITDEEKAAGKATINGLNPETSYDIYLYNGEKERGHRSFTTIADLEGAILVHADDDLKTLLSEAEEGAVFALYGGTHVIEGSEDVAAGSAVISKSVTIKGIYPTNIPVINGRFQLNDGASLTLSQVILDGTGTSGDQCFNYKTDGATHSTLNLQDVVVRNYVKGVFYLNVAAVVENMTFNNCVFSNIVCDGGDMFDCRKGLIKNFTLTNSTLYNCAADRDILRFDDASATYPEQVCNILVDHNTFDNVVTKSGSTRRYLYVRFVSNKIKWTNNLITNSTSMYSNQSKTDPDAMFSGNAYFNASENFWTLVEGKVVLADSSPNKVEDPTYADPENGDFTITNESVKKLGVGDPRWCK